MENSLRPFVKVIKEICRELGVTCVPFSYDWIFRLEKDGKVAFIFGYQFGINSSASQLICTDKCAASEMLLFNKIPSVEHSFFMAPRNIKYVGESGNWARLIDLLEEHGRLVCKNNEGSGGSDVYLVSNAYELEAAVHKIFKRFRSMAVSPYYEIENEYRVVVLDGQVKLIYKKQIPFIKGDGKTSLYNLILTYLDKHPDLPLHKKLQLEKENVVLEKGQIFFLNWKHNLGQGAQPEIIHDGKLKQDLSELALDAAAAVKIVFASVDIIQTEEGLKVLEINSGIMMDHFMQVNDDHYQIAKDIYKQAVSGMFLGE